jgi:diguanylate cyclase (GGDEF)-like protein
MVKPWVWPAGVALLYFAADLFLNKFALGDGWQIFWPLNGVTVAILVMRPRDHWWKILVAVAVGTGAGEYLDGNSLGSMLLQRMLSVMEVGLSAWLLPPFSNLDTWLRKPGLYPRFAAAVLVGPAVSGVLAATYFHMTDLTPWLEAFDGWALADAMGIACVVPLVLSLRSPEARALIEPERVLITAVTLAGAVVVMALIFTSSEYPLIFILYPLLMLVDWKLGLCGSSLALCCSCIVAVFQTEHGFGPFASNHGLGMPRDLAVQVFLGFHLLGFLPISILFLERRWMETELRNSLAQAAALASLDGLTGVANRRALDQSLQDQWMISLHRRTPLAMLMIDADHFKAFNDKLGHQAGDECLRSIAATLARHAPGPGDLVARFGGEEFAMLLPGTPLKTARSVAEGLRAAIFNLGIAHPMGTDQRVTVSIGCAAIFPSDKSTFQQLVAAADEALYAAKRAGRNCVSSLESGAEVWSKGTAARKLRERVAASSPRRASNIRD